jgi:hypothetical protein
MAKIKIKNSVTPGSVPAGLSFGEVAVNIPDKKIFVGNAVESTVTLYDPNSHVLSFNGLTGAVSFSNYVSSVNGKTGGVTLAAGTNIGITLSGNIITISATGLSAAASDFVTQGKLSADVGITSGADYVIPFVDDYDPQGWYDSTTKQFKPNIAGYYNISLNGWWAQAGITNGQSNIQARKNGTDTFLIAQAQLQVGSGYNVGGSKTIFLNGSTDYVDFSAYTSNTTSQTLQIGTASGSGTWFAAFLISNNTPPTAYVSSFNGSTGAVSFSNYVVSVNGSTGAITNVARTNQGNTFSVQQVMSSGITSSNLYVTSGGATFDSQVSVSTTTNAIDVVATTDGAGLRVAQATSGSSARVGAIRLGRSTTAASNVYLEGYVGTFRVFNGLSGTAATPGTKMLELSTSGGAIFGIPIAGATFNGNIDMASTIAMLHGYNSSGYLKLQSTSTLATIPGVPTVVLQDADTDLGGVPSITINPSSSVSNINLLVLGNLATATTISGTLGVTGTSTFVARSTHSGGITTANLFVSSGATFNSRASFSGGLTAANLYVSSGATFGSAVASDGGFRITSSAINAQTDSYSLQESDNGKIVTVNAGTLKTITVPSGLSVGFNCTVIRVGSGRVTFSASGTTINSVDGLLEIASQHGAASLLSYASNTFNLSGNLG